MSRSKRFLGQSLLQKFQSSKQRNSLSSQICPVSYVPSGLVGTRFLARNVPFSRQHQGNCSTYCPVSYHRSHRKAIFVPSDISDRIFMSHQAEDHPRSGRDDNSFMPRRPYAGVAPAQPGPTPVASTSTSAGAAPGCDICVWSRLRQSKDL
jgi:hypothetical protein